MESIEPARLDFLVGLEHPELSPHERLAIEGDTWRLNDSDFTNYCNHAAAVGIGDLESIVRSRLGKQAINVALDIAGGANGMAVQELIRKGLVQSGIVTNLTDRRAESTKNLPNLSHIAGDIVEPGTWQQIIEKTEEIAPDGLSLILHRPFGALQGLPPEFYSGSTHLLLDILRPGGLFFTEVPLRLMLPDGNETNEICSSILQRPDIESMVTARSGVGGIPNTVLMLKQS